MDRPQLNPPSLSSEQAPRLDGLFLAKVDLAVNEAWSPDLVEKAGKPPIIVRYGLRIFRTQQSAQRQVHLNCELAQADEKVPASYKGSILTVADVIFPQPDQMSAEVMDQASAWFAVNTLVGAARVYVDMVTGLGPYPRVLLNPIPPTELVRKASVQAGSEPVTPLYPSEIGRDPSPANASPTVVAESHPKPQGT